MTSEMVGPAAGVGYGVPSVADFAVARVAGVSARCLDRLVFHEARRYIRLALACESEIASTGGDLESALHELIPRLDYDRNLRRRALSLKRSIHNRRLSKATKDDIGAISSLLSESRRKQLAEWYRLVTSRESTLASGATAYQGELTHASAALLAQIANPVIQQGLAIASPDLLHDLVRHGEDQKCRGLSKRLRSCAAYLSRVTMKTSPLSTFTQIALAHIDAGGGKPVQPCTGARPTGILHSVQLLRALPHDWLRLAAGTRDLASAFSFEANAGISRIATDPSKVDVLRSEPQFSAKLFWRREALERQSLDESLQKLLLRGRRFSYRELISIGEIRHRSDAHEFIVELLDRNLIHPVAPYSRMDFHPLRMLAEALRDLKTTRAMRIAELMHQMQDEINAAESADAEQRLRITSTVRRLAAEIYVALERTPPSWLNASKLLVENVAFDGQTITLPSQVKWDLTQAASRFRTHTVRSKLYDRICQYFVRRFGWMGETPDILIFLLDFLAREDFPELLARAMAEDKLAASEPADPRSFLPGGGSAVPPTMTMFFQVDAESAHAIERGDYRLILNQVISGEGGLLGRFANISGLEQPELQAHLSGWVKQLYVGVPVLELLVCADVNSLQMEQGHCGQVLEWPGELPSCRASGSVMRLDQLRLRGAADGTLYLTDDSGQPVCVSYQGVVPAYFAPQALRLLLLIANPWVQAHAIDTEEAIGDDGRPDNIQFWARQQEGRVIFQRARWRIPAHTLVRREKNESDFDFFVRVERWRAENGLPEEVFARVEEPQSGSEAKERKPVWVHFGSPHAIEILSELAANDASLILSEVLPARVGHWVLASDDVTGSDRRASEFMALVRWPIPQPKTPGKHTSHLARGLTKPANDWLYLKIYPRNLNQLDHVVRQIVSPAIRHARADADLERWFFVRYADERGWHIRLRLRGSEPARRRWFSEFSGLIDATLPSLPEDNSTERRLIPTSGAARVQTAQAGYALASYEPECEKYGGVAGMGIAEEFFEASSELAVQALQQVSASGDHQILVLALTRSLVWQTHETQADRECFLRRYLWYWTGQDGFGARRVRRKLREAAARRMDFLSRQFASLKTHPVLSAFLGDFERAIRATLSKLQRVERYLTESPSSLSFEYLHMSNNRLGVFPLEEAYVAALLLESCRGCTQCQE
jgi:thiopeptide-type bacteriocin biosynthesis protein